jgi:dipeptidyl aminopeptidase/acylaminoacyl peptidase
VLWQPADGASDAEALGFVGNPFAFTADGRMLYGASSNNPGGADVFMRSMANAADAPTPVLTSTGRERNVQLSPDGRFIAYESEESGRAEIYVRPFPDTAAARWQISSNGGKTPLWNTDGRELYYYEGAEQSGSDFVSGALMAVSIALAPDFRPGAPQQLFAGDYVATGTGRHYDVAPGGQRFLMIKLVGEVQLSPPELTFAQNWLAAVKRRLAESGDDR